MATPSYASGASNTPNVWTCTLCGAAVVDTSKHTSWHVAGVV